MRRAAIKPHATFHYTVQEIVLFLLVQSLHIVDNGCGVVGRSGSRCVVIPFFLFVALTFLAFRSGLNDSRSFCPPPQPSAPFAATTPLLDNSSFGDLGGYTGSISPHSTASTILPCKIPPFRPPPPVPSFFPTETTLTSMGSGSL